MLRHYFDKAEIKNKVILDAGCRVGEYSQALVEMGARKIIGIDLSSRCIQVAKKRLKGKSKKMKFYQGDITNLKMFPDRFFDIVFCLGTINYLNPKGVKKAMKEFARVTKPDGIMLVLFQKNKGLLIQLVSKIATRLSVNVYLFFIDHFSFLFKSFVERMIGRKISYQYLKYDIFFGLRNLNFGIPVKIDKKFRVPTVTCEYCSEKTTASFKINVPKTIITRDND